jgi:hypothetical protein
MPPTGRSSLKINRRAFMLTYSQVGDENEARQTACEAVDRIESIFPGSHWSVGCEQHDDEGWHCHLGVVRAEGGQAVKVGERLDIRGHLVNISPHGMKRTDLISCLKYPLKEDEIGFCNWEDLESLFPDDITGTPAERRDKAFAQALESDTYEGAMLSIAQGAPADLVLNGDKITRFFQNKFAPVFEHKYDVSSFNRPLVDWRLVDKRSSLVIIGKPNMGKTHWALAHFERPLFVNDIDKIKQFSPILHDGIVFDDVSFTMWPPTAMICLFEREVERDIRVRYSLVTIPAGTKKIFCANSLDAFRPNDLTKVDQDTLDGLISRQHVVRIDDKLF